MSGEYYKTLEVPKTATHEEIQKAYRRLARKHHPDMNQNDPKGAKEKFQKIQEAFDVIGNPEKRNIYDQYGVSPDQMGSAGAQGPFQWSYGGGGGGRSGGFQFENIDEIIRMFGGGNGFGNGQSPEEFFTAGTGAGRRSAPVRGTDLERTLSIPFQMSVEGGSVDMKLRRQGVKEEVVVVKIPAGITDGKKIRLSGLGHPGQNGGKAGNLLIIVQVAEHPFFTRKENNLYVNVPVSLKEAVFGAKIDVPTPQGNVSLTVPAGSSSGTKLRVRGCGVAAKEAPGDLFAELSVVLPKKWTPEEKELLQKIVSEQSEPIRKELTWK